MTRPSSPRAARTIALALLAVPSLAASLAATPAPQDDDALPALRTWTQKQFAGPCKARDGEDSAACLRDQHFAKLFPKGLLIGDPDGPDGDDEYAVLLTSAEAVAAFLPRTGDPRLLTEDQTDPRPKDDGVGGGFGGQLVAAKLNLALARAGLLGDGGGAFADLSLDDGVAQPLRARRFSHLVQLGDHVISGAAGRRGVMEKRIVDVDGDGTADTTPLALFEALKAMNNSFAGGRASRHVRGPEARESGPGGVVVEDGGRVGGGDRGRGRDADTADGDARGDRDHPRDGGQAERSFDVRVDLTRSEGAPDRARGQLRLRADADEGRQRLDLSAYGLGSNGRFTAWVERTPDSGAWVQLGVLTRGEERDDQGEDDEPRGWHLKLDSRQGDPVPEGLSHVSALIGKRVVVRGDERPVLGAVVPTPTPGRDEDEGRGGMGGMGGGMGRKQLGDGADRDHDG